MRVCGRRVWINRAGLVAAAIVYALLRCQSRIESKSVQLSTFKVTITYSILEVWIGHDLTLDGATVRRFARRLHREDIGQQNKKQKIGGVRILGAIIGWFEEGQRGCKG